MESWYRQFLLLLAAIIFLMTPLELVFAEHTEGAIQWVPFGLCGIGLLALLMWRLSFPRAVLIVRTAMIASVLGGLFGIVEHFEHNLSFELEIRPNAGWTDVLWDALSGASPLLAPGIMILAAVLGLAAIRGDKTQSAES